MKVSPRRKVGQLRRRRNVRMGSYLISRSAPGYSTDIGLYREDVLAALDKTPKQIENIKKYMRKVSNDHNLKLAIEAKKNASISSISL